MTLDEYQQISLTNGDNVKLNEYQIEAVSTAIYPGKLAYPTLGLAGEAGELIAAVCTRSEETSKELGDVLWYVANVAEDCELPLSGVCSRMKFATKARTGLWGMDDMMEELAIAVGVVAENVKKTIRDTDGVLTDARRKNIKLALRQVMAILTDISRQAEWCASLEECAKINIEKLRSRQERGVLKGDGDSR